MTDAANGLPPAYSESAAARYEEDVSPPEDTDACVNLLAELAANGPALELGVGGGRVAIPLAARGLDVHGIDDSTAMLDQLRRKPGGQLVRTVHGDFATFILPTRFSVVYVVFDTITALDTQDRQVNCFQTVCAHLSEGGVFVVEASIPDRSPRLEAASQGYSLAIKSMHPERVQLEASWHDAANQMIYSQWISIRNGSAKLFPFSMRYAWPSELDLMAKFAGLRLRERWGGWGREAFTSTSVKHVSVYEKP